MGFGLRVDGVVGLAVPHLLGPSLSVIVEQLFMVEEEGGYLLLLLAVYFPLSGLHDVHGDPVVETDPLCDFKASAEGLELRF